MSKLDDHDNKRYSAFKVNREPISIYLDEGTRFHLIYDGSWCLITQSPGGTISREASLEEVALWKALCAEAEGHFWTAHFAGG